MRIRDLLARTAQTEAGAIALVCAALWAGGVVVATLAFLATA